MSTYSFTGDLSNLAALPTELETKFTTDLDTEISGVGLAFSTTSTSAVDVDTVTVAGVEADDVLICMVTANVSASDTSDNWVFQLNLGSGTKTSGTKRWKAKVAATTGQTDIITMQAGFLDIAAGTYSLALTVLAASAPSGTFYADSCDLTVFKLKQRA